MTARGPAAVEAKLLVWDEDVAFGEHAGERQLHDEVITLLVIGTETAAASLAWTLHLLARHPQAQARVHEELDSVLVAGRSTTRPWARASWLHRAVFAHQELMTVVATVAARWRPRPCRGGQERTIAAVPCVPSA